MTALFERRNSKRIGFSNPRTSAIMRVTCRSFLPSRLRRSFSPIPAANAGRGYASDTDLTLSLHRHRQRIVYVPDAIAWTEAPETVHALVRQRSRWAYGTLQCLWKHRDVVFNWNYRALGWFLRRWNSSDRLKVLKNLWSLPPPRSKKRCFDSNSLRNLQVSMGGWNTIERSL
jgi:Glycosyltransferase like family 2